MNPSSETFFSGFEHILALFTKISTYIQHFKRNVVFVLRSTRNKSIGSHQITAFSLGSHELMQFSQRKLCFQAQKIGELGEKIGTTIVRMEALGNEGKVEEAMALSKEIEEFKRKKRDLEVSYCRHPKLGC